jgi:ADP-ribosylglycohydrolase
VSIPSEARWKRALVSLEGLSVGDAFGERFFVHPHMAQLLFGGRALPAPPWPYTDDTQMALSIVETLKQHGAIDQQYLAHSFGRHYDISRGYGPAMHQLLPKIRSDISWSKAARSLFGGEGSFGNGAAMRVAPLGAYFADDLDAVVEHARRSAEVTHAHPEAAAGAIAVAVAAALAYQLRGAQTQPDGHDFINDMLSYVPESAVKEGLRYAARIPEYSPVKSAVAVLGNGSRVTAQDTVPFTLWCAGHNLDDFEEAIWTAVNGLGDRDTTCAIVGGIVACHTGVEGIPAEWVQAREPLPAWHR